MFEHEPNPCPTINQYRPISNFVVLEKSQLLPTETITAGGIVIPEVVEKRNAHQIGTVLRIGPGQLLKDGTRVPPQFKVGDQVVYDPYKGRVPNPRKSLYELVLPADAILGVLEELPE